MPDPEAVPLEALRQALAARVEEAGHLPTIAREIGISRSSLQKFLAGSNLYAKTRKRLLDWRDRHSGTLVPDLSSPEIAGVIAAILTEVPPEGRSAMRDELIETLRGLYAAHPDHCPEWIAEVAGAALTEPGRSPRTPDGAG
jgi:hypothetical protein